jgi:hypothetical protein
MGRRRLRVQWTCPDKQHPSAGARFERSRLIERAAPIPPLPPPQQADQKLLIHKSGKRLRYLPSIPEAGVPAGGVCHRAE